MKFKHLAEIRRQLVGPENLNKYQIYLGYEHFSPGALRYERTGSSDSLTSSKQLFFPNDTIYGKLRPYFEKLHGYIQIVVFARLIFGCLSLK